MSVYIFTANTADVNGSIKRNENININPVDIKLACHMLSVIRSELGVYYNDFYRNRRNVVMLPKPSIIESYDDRKISKLVNGNLLGLYFGTGTKYAAAIKIGTLRMYTNKGLSKKESPYYELEYTDKTQVPFEAQVYLGYDAKNSNNKDGDNQQNKYFICDGDVIIGVCTTSETFERIDTIVSTLYVDDDIVFTSDVKSTTSSVVLSCNTLDILVGDRDDFCLTMDVSVTGDISFHALVPAHTSNDVIVPSSVYQCEKDHAPKLFSALFGHDGIDMCIATAMSNEDTAAFTVHNRVTLSGARMDKLSCEYYIKIGNNVHELSQAALSWDANKEKGNCYLVDEYLTIRVPMHDETSDGKTHLGDMCFMLDVNTLSKRELDVIDKYMNNNKECKLVTKLAGDVIFGTPDKTRVIAY